MTLTCSLTFSCTGDNNSTKDTYQVSTTDTTENTETNQVASGEQLERIESIKTHFDSLNNNLPLHGALNQKQIDSYYPDMLDTIRDRRIIGAEPIDLMPNSTFHVTMLHNTGTFDQMFLCTHDHDFNLLDSYYIGTATQFDRTSHTIEYKKINDTKLEFHHVEWGWVNKDGEDEIDTLSYDKYTLTIDETGKINKK